MRKLRVFAFPIVFVLLVLFSVIWLNLAQDVPDTVRMGAFNVTFNSRTYDSATNRTTFSYTVKGADAFNTLKMFQVGIPETCDLESAVVSYTPTEGVDFGLDPDSLVPGIRWTLDLGPAQSRDYTLTFQGAVPVGNFYGTVRDTSGVYGREIRGPNCTVSDETKFKVTKYVAVPGADPLTSTWSWEDANDSPGLQTEIGATVYYRFVVENKSGSSLSNLSLYDNKVTITNCTIPATLANSQQFECVAGPVIVESGLHTNTVTAFGQAPSVAYIDEDVANYTGVPAAPDQLYQSPLGEISTSLGNPTYTWKTVSGASSYNLFVATNNETSFRVIFSGTISASEYCSETLCEVDLTDRPDGVNYWLANDAYQVWFRAANADWRGPFEFTIDTPQSTAVSILPVTGTDRSEPYYNWALTGNAIYASWFNVYLAPKDRPWEPLGSMWYSRSEACEGDEGTICSIRSLVDVANGSYVIYIRSWGPGGFSTGGIQNSGYAGPMEFVINETAPQAPTGLAVSEGGTSFSWQHSGGASWYNVWIGTPSPDYTTRYWEWKYFEDLGCNMTCTLSGLNIPSGSHIWYVQAWGPGGFSTNGDFGGWNQGPDFTK